MHFKYENLLLRKEKGKQTIECVNAPFEGVSVSKLLDNYEGMDKEIIKQLKIYFDEIQNLAAENENLKNDKAYAIEDLDKTNGCEAITSSDILVSSLSYNFVVYNLGTISL